LKNNSLRLYKNLKPAGTLRRRTTLWSTPQREAFHRSPATMFGLMKNLYVYMKKRKDRMLTLVPNIVLCALTHLRMCLRTRDILGSCENASFTQYQGLVSTKGEISASQLVEHTAKRLAFSNVFLERILRACLLIENRSALNGHHVFYLSVFEGLRYILLGPPFMISSWVFSGASLLFCPPLCSLCLLFTSRALVMNQTGVDRS
jgi:hypothetical protein